MLSCTGTIRFSARTAPSGKAISAEQDTKRQPQLQRGKVLQRGWASYYAGKFHGRQTANGEVYDSLGRTAAHNTLPFETMVRVRNISNGKTVTVRVTDRGPFAKDRIIDLSYTAAREIDMIGPGTAEVEIYLAD